MAATPPRSASPAPAVVPKPGHNLQISPNLEALLQHDELTRRNSSSPTSAYHNATPTSGFPISLPPPPPRKANGGRKASHLHQREQEAFPTARTKEGQRWKGAAVAGSWPDALPASFPQDGASVAESTSGSSSRPVTPNPYLNPTPVLRPINTHDFDEAPTPKQADKSLPSEPRPDSSRPAVETRRRTAVSDVSHCPNALHKVEKILWMGRDSLNLFSSSANGVKRDSDRRNDRTESGDVDAVQDRQIRQVPATSTPTVSRPSSRFDDRDIAIISLSSKSGTPYLHAVQQELHIAPAETASHPSHPGPGPINDVSPSIPFPTSHFLPRLSLPSIFMSNNPPPQRPQPGDNDSDNGNDYLSFIDFFSPSMTDESSQAKFQDNPRESCSSHHRLPSIPPSLYSSSHHNLSSSTLSSMRFAPPSPTSLTVQPSPTYPNSEESSPSTALSKIVFAPPSPSAECIPTQLQPLSDPPSPYSPLQFAPLSSPLDIDEPTLCVAQGLTPERGRKLKSKKRSKSSSPYHVHTLISALPPTTNELDANERADRIRRNRKLARVFGRTPGAEEPATDVDEPRVSKKLHSPSLAALLTKQKRHRHAMSVSLSLKPPGMKTEPSIPWQMDDLWSPDGRRHSTPLASGFTLIMDDERNRAATMGSVRLRKLVDSPEAASTRSFIDLSDEDARDDDVSELSCPVPHQHQHQHRRLQHSNSTPSLVESIDSVAQAELERRRKRERLAKLHRCLGSRVPPEAVNGNVFGPPLPPPAPAAPPEESNREHWLRKNKNTLQDCFDHGKDELDEREKARNVRRAQKMERVFGTPPPQVLFHTRMTRSTMPASQPTSPAGFNPYVLTLDLPSSSRNRNQSVYTGKALHRQGPSDSSRCLLPRKDDTPQSSPSSFAQSFADSFTESLSGYQQVLAQSSVYLNYQHSLNSLIDIIDRDDRRSLLELHRFLHGEDGGSSSEEETTVNPRRASNATSLRSERRHSLPSNASMTSLSSEFYAPPQTSRFQIRRRRAAKLTNFFGVDYRELIRDILKSIEKGVKEELKQGTLQPQEVEVLLHRVRSLRSLKDPFLAS